MAPAVLSCLLQEPLTVALDPIEQSGEPRPSLNRAGPGDSRVCELIHQVLSGPLGVPLDRRALALVAVLLDPDIGGR